MRALVGSIRRKSRAMVWREISPRAPASSTPVGPPPMTTNVRSASCSADLQRVLQGLEPRSQYLPVVVAKISVAGARCEDERVVAELAPIERELAVGEIHLFDPREEDRDVGGLAQDGPQRGRNVGWIQRGGGHLREQRRSSRVTRTGWPASSRAAYSPPKPPPTITTCGRAAARVIDVSCEGARPTCQRRGHHSRMTSAAGESTRG